MSAGKVIVAGFGAIILIGSIGAACGGSSDATAPVKDPTLTVTNVDPTPEPTAQTPPAVIKKKVKTYNDGTYEVGLDIKAGKYKTKGGPACYYARLKSDDTNDIITNNLSDGPMIVVVKSTDQYLELTGGCKWTKS